jgi:hypothetical protein
MKPISLKTLKKALREAKQAPPYLSELTRAEVYSWMALYLDHTARGCVYELATSLAFAPKKKKKHMKKSTEQQVRQDHQTSAQDESRLTLSSEPMGRPTVAVREHERNFYLLTPSGEEWSIEWRNGALTLRLIAVGGSVVGATGAISVQPHAANTISVCAGKH